MSSPSAGTGLPGLGPKTGLDSTGRRKAAMKVLRAKEGTATGVTGAEGTGVPAKAEKTGRLILRIATAFRNLSPKSGKAEKAENPEKVREVTKSWVSEGKTWPSFTLSRWRDYNFT
jgi:hypothetical protein